MGSKTSTVENKTRSSLWLMLLLLFVIISVQFRYSFLPHLTVASNDGPLGSLVADAHRMPDGFFGAWEDLNTVGYRGGGASPGITYGLQWVLGPVLYSKFYAPIAIFLLGLAAWCFFRQMKFSPVACVLGGLAAALNSGFFSVACWGVAAHTNTLAMTFFAMACLADDSSKRRWLRVVLAGLAVGVGVAEGADVGAIFSVFVAAFALYQAWTKEGPRAKNLALGGVRIGLVAVFAAILAAQPISALVATAISGVSGTQQDQKTKEERWDFATQWSMPKREAMALLIPGLFGYRMDTPKKITAFESAYEGGGYWGGVGRDPNLDRAYDDWESHGKSGPPPNGLWRFSGGGNYPGILVLLVAAFAVVQSFRKTQSIFAPRLRAWIWFWFAIACLGLLLAFGRHAPFYHFFYLLPYASTIRNPAKFMHVVNLAVVILFGFGINGLSRQYLASAKESTLGVWTHFKTWWSKASPGDRRWTRGCAIFIVASLLGWLIYASSRTTLESFLQTTGFDAELSKKMAGFSIGEVGWFLFFLVLSVVLVSLVLSGFFGGKRARLAGILLGILLVADLGRANLPWIIFWDYSEQYATNPVLDLLRQKPYEHRVAGLPPLFVDDRFTQAIRIPGQWVETEKYFMQVIYGVEWSQHLFLYYNIQSLDIIQMPRMPEDLAAFDKTFSPATMADISRLFARRWELTNTRYILGAFSYLEVLNQVVDPLKHRFKVAERFDISPKPGVVRPTGADELTAIPSTNGSFAVFEFTGALPRAGLYSDWEVNTNKSETLSRLASPEFDPAKTVLVAERIKRSASTNGGNDASAKVEFTSYSPNHFSLKAGAKNDSVLLLCDRYDPNWKVLVDKAPAQLLHCNYLMRGVQLAPGEHLIEFHFAPPVGLLYVSAAAVLLGFCLLAFLIVVKSPEENISETAIKPEAGSPIIPKK